MGSCVSRGGSPASHVSSALPPVGVRSPDMVCPRRLSDPPGHSDAHPVLFTATRSSVTTGHSRKPTTSASPELDHSPSASPPSFSPLIDFPKPHSPPPSPPSPPSPPADPPPTIAVYQFPADSDSDSDVDDAVDEMELITEEQVFAAADELMDDSPIELRRASLISSSPLPLRPSISISPHSSQRRLTLSFPPPSFHIILIDEDPHHASLIHHYLSKHSFITTITSNPHEAIALMVSLLSADQSVDLIIVDAHMYYDNQPFLDYIKSNSLLSFIPVILMSPDVESAAVNRSINRGAYDHLTKPIIKNILINVIRVVRDAIREEKKAAILKEWGDRYKQTMIEERKSNGGFISRGSLKHTPSIGDGNRIRVGVVGMDGDDSRSIGEWLDGEGIEYEEYDMDGVEREVKAMERKEWSEGRAGKSSRVPSSLPSRRMSNIDRIAESDEDDSVEMGRVKQGKGVDVLLVDMDGLDGDETARYHRLLELATERGISVILMSEVASSLSIPLTAAIDAVLQKPLRKDTFCAKFSTVLHRRHARINSTILARRAESYKEMVDKIRQKHASPISHSDSLHLTPHRRTRSTTIPETSSERFTSDVALGMKDGRPTGIGRISTKLIGPQWRDDSKDDGKEEVAMRGSVVMTRLQHKVQTWVLQLEPGRADETAAARSPSSKKTRAAEKNPSPRELGGS